VEQVTIAEMIFSFA